MEQEMLVLSGNLLKIDKDITSLSNKMEPDMNLIADKIDQDLITLSNKLDQVNETVDNLTSHQPGNGSHGPPAAVTGVPAPATPGPWKYTPKLKAKVYAIAYKLVALPTIGAYTALETPAGDLIMNSLFSTVKKQSRTSQLLGLPNNFLQSSMEPRMLGPSKGRRPWLRMLANTPESVCTSWCCTILNTTLKPPFHASKSSCIVSPENVEIKPTALTSRPIGPKRLWNYASGLPTFDTRLYAFSNCFEKAEVEEISGRGWTNS
ncbi:uncharacterized protein MELLADRAFT_95074 [Melampsora larici-populina 98AG31]|uniref:Uncharacterized protein n=1 Tax=Melampsora larici-populina (strain 98AG31 / pathotype 3-4-7) TaxID=747676 RepID=F4S914_MELLP|nr:uncharacterized protein MELLADRAFT_95074 [Melampsora larici-populina 98AG31]EGF98834.1 hypothetical protein MELLADRAFT_95074 [Melampsora larici-populina 98AG31]